jgi:hypothetical protein
MTTESDPPPEGAEGRSPQIADLEAAAAEKWNGFDAPYWTLPQTILWSVTGDYTAVNDASDYGESYSRAAAAAVMKKWINEWELSRDEVQYAADELWRACLHGKVTAYGDNDRPIDVITWRHLEIVLDEENVPFVRRREEQLTIGDVVFSRDDVLPVFGPCKEEYDIASGHMHNSHEWRDVVERVRRAIFQELWIEKLSLTPTENYLLKRYGAGALDFSKSLIPGWFSWSEAQDPPFSPNSELGLALAKARDQYQQLATQYLEALQWLNVNDITLKGVDGWQPGELRHWHERTLGALTEKLNLEFGDRTKIEPPGPPKGSELAKKSGEDKKPDILEIAKTFVKDGMAPSVRDHTTLVMSVLKKEYPGNHPKRKQVEELLTIEFKNQRRSRGRTNRSR